MVGEVRADVEGGALLSEALARHPNVFTRIYISMVEAGEAAGILDDVLDRLATQIEKEANLKRRVKGAMVYPVMVVSFAFLVLVAMLLFIVPIFQKLYVQFNGQLPDADPGDDRRLGADAHALVHHLPARSGSPSSASSAGSARREAARGGTASS